MRVPRIGTKSGVKSARKRVGGIDHDSQNAEDGFVSASPKTTASPAQSGWSPELSETPAISSRPSLLNAVEGSL